MKRIALCLALILAITPINLPAQETVTIRVDANAKIGPLKPIWAYVGYDEPNYTMKHGQKLVAELAKMNPVPVYFRAHSLLVTGDGKPALKWGSTNAYTEDAAGKPVYDWKIVDQIFDTYIKVGAKPLVRSDSCPKRCRSSRSRTGITGNPASHTRRFTPAGPIRRRITRSGGVGPAMGTPFGRALRQRGSPYLVLGVVERAGHQLLEGRAEEYNKLYDYTADAIKRALPQARVGGPATTGPSAQRAGAFFDSFSNTARAARITSRGRRERRSISSPITRRGTRESSKVTCRWG